MPGATVTAWWVGLASTPALKGQWSRVSRINPASIEEVLIENPIVTPLPGGGYLCVYDSNMHDAIGYAFSADGAHWEAGTALVVHPEAEVWSGDVRTPLGLVPEGGAEYRVFYTGFDRMPDWDKLLAGDGRSANCGIGWVRVRLDR